jgi:hypothetical protein
MQSVAGCLLHAGTAVLRNEVPSLHKVAVVIEVKGCWNNSILTAIDSQLVADYLRLNGLTYGIYLVGWFVCKEWDTKQNKLVSHTFTDAQKEVRQLAAAYDGKTNPERVKTIVLDCRYPDSTAS